MLPQHSPIHLCTRFLSVAVSRGLAEDWQHFWLSHVLEDEATLESYFCFGIWIDGEYFKNFSDSSTYFYCIEEKILGSQPSILTKYLEKFQPLMRKILVLPRVIFFSTSLCKRRQTWRKGRRKNWVLFLIATILMAT